MLLSCQFLKLKADCIIDRLQPSTPPVRPSYISAVGYLCPFHLTAEENFRTSTPSVTDTPTSSVIGLAIVPASFIEFFQGITNRHHGHPVPQINFGRRMWSAHPALAVSVETSMPASLEVSPDTLKYHRRPRKGITTSRSAYRNDENPTAHCPAVRHHSGAARLWIVEEVSVDLKLPSIKTNLVLFVQSHPRRCAKKEEPEPQSTVLQPPTSPKLPI